MAFADIKATTTDFGSEIARLTAWLSALPGNPATVPDIFLEEARAQLKRDLGLAWSFNLDDATHLAYLDDRADLVTGRVQHALALLQMALAYESQAGSTEELSYRLGGLYRRRYEEAIGSASSWGVSYGGARISSIRQMI